MQEIIIENVTIKNCTHCNMEHRGLLVQQLNEPVDGYTHRTTCPFKNQPVYIKLLSH